jgi:prolyl-tRNA synthetase
MKFSQLLCPTLKEVPKDAEVISHKLMLRAGMIRKVTSGIYSFLPLGLRVLRKFENIVREEMDNVGAQEILLPTVVPAELWQESGRWDFYGKELLRIKDRHEKYFCFGPTHEETITDLVRKNIKSYKQLPLSLYQIQNKFRDEIRPRFGIMRAREFGMKDAYSFHETDECLDNTYKDMDGAYRRIFERCGLTFKVVEADSGAIGGDCSAEFMVTAQTGEDAIIECTNCSYAANLEAAENTKPNKAQNDDSLPTYEKIETPNKKTIKEVSELLKAKEEDFIKTLVYAADEETVVVLIRGHHNINEFKLASILKCENLEMATEEVVYKITNAPVGFAGPVGLGSEIRVIADYGILEMGAAITGANEKDMHLTNVLLTRDYQPNDFYDLRDAEENDKCARCAKGSYQTIRGIEVGHIFKLGRKYSNSMKAAFLNSEGKEKILTMGCYGIGIGRTVAAAIEQNHDDRGIIWPAALAPFQVSIILTSKKEPALTEFSDNLYKKMKAKKIEVLYDDRKDSAGIKFKDSELIGIPIMVVVGKKYKESQELEIKIRKSGESITCKENELIPRLVNLLENGS